MSSCLLNGKAQLIGYCAPPSRTCYFVCESCVINKELMLNLVQFCEAARPDTSLELAQKNDLFKNQTSLHMMMASDISDIIVEQHDLLI